MIKKTIVLGWVLASLSTVAQANPLEVRAARMKLNKQSSALLQHKIAYEKAKQAYKAMKSVYNNQKKTLNRLEKADRAEVRAMRKSYDSTSYRYNPYIADNSHASTVLTWE